jgi:hypothetical protein
VPLPAVSAHLGHGSIRTTQEIYSHMIHGQDDEAARKVGVSESARGRGATAERARAVIEQSFVAYRSTVLSLSLRSLAGLF